MGNNKDDQKKLKLVPKTKKDDRIDFSSYKPSYNRGFNVENMEQIQDSLIARGYPAPQRQAILASVLHESGGDPKAVSSDGNFKGIIQWGPDRYPNTDKLDEQIHYMLEEVSKPASPGWTHGGGGLPFIKNLQEGFNGFWNASNPYDAAMYFNKGYVRPAEEDARKNRAKEANNMNKK